MRLSNLHVRALLVAAANYRMKYRSWLLDALTVSSKYTHEVTTKKYTVGEVVNLRKADLDDKVTVGDVVCCRYEGGNTVGIVIEGDEGAPEWSIAILSDGTTPCWKTTDVFDVPAGIVAQHLGTCPCSQEAWGDTTVGRCLVNMCCLQYPFGFQIFKYVNKYVEPDKLENLVKDQLLAGKVTVREFEKFFDHLYFIGHISELAAPSMTVKSLQTSDKIPEIKRKFIEEHKGQMGDPLVIQKLEELLVKTDKEYLGDDPSTVFFDALGKNSYTLHRKKMFLTVGGIPAFDSDASSMDFIPNSLAEGWIIDKLPSIANEIRKGSYSRGVETAKGGAETKLIWRAFGDIALVEDDCGTKRTIKIDCSAYNIKNFIGRTIRDDGVDVVITDENADKYKGRVVNMYSPLTCATKDNFCYKCCGQRAKQLGAKQLGVQTIQITSTFMQLSMKNMHGTTLEVQDNKLEDILL